MSSDSANFIFRRAAEWRMSKIRICPAHVTVSSGNSLAVVKDGMPSYGADGTYCRKALNIPL